MRHESRAEGYRERLDKGADRGLAQPPFATAEGGRTARRRGLRLTPSTAHSPPKARKVDRIDDE
ncbi:MAG: hypothetical protein AAFN74_06675, partial [Myxococcota bacterium]